MRATAAGTERSHTATLTGGTRPSHETPLTRAQQRCARVFFIGAVSNAASVHWQPCQGSVTGRVAEVGDGTISGRSNPNRLILVGFGARPGASRHVTGLSGRCSKSVRNAPRSPIAAPGAAERLAWVWPMWRCGAPIVCWGMSRHWRIGDTGTCRAGSAGSDCGVAAALTLVLYRDDDLFDDDHDAGRDRNGDEGTE